MHNLDVIFNAQDEAGLFLWETLRNNFYYSAINVPKATDDFRDIDRALVWGSTETWSIPIMGCNGI